MRGDGGFVPIPRAILEHAAFNDEGEALCFVWLLMKAAWRPVRVRYRDRPIYLQAGELAVSVRHLANTLGRSPAWINRFLSRLKTETLIETRTETGVNVISICNYAELRGQDWGTETARETGVETEVKQERNTEQEDKNLRKDIQHQTVKNGGRHFLPNDWKPPPISDLPPKSRECAGQWPPGAYEREGEAFACYWQSEHKMKTDWRKTWANRIITNHWRVMQDARRQGFTGQGGGDKPLYQLVNEGRA